MTSWKLLMNYLFSISILTSLAAGPSANDNARTDDVIKRSIIGSGATARMKCNYFGQTKCKQKKHKCDLYDVIIIGAGTAGCVTARYVSDNPNISVLLLEQGANEENNEIVNNPFGFDPPANTLNLFAAATDPRTTDIMTNFQFLGGPNGVYDPNTFIFHSGKGNGGASNHCYLESQRTTPGYHIFMQSFAGSEALRWGPDSVTQSYIEMETYGGPPNTPFRGYSGPFNMFQNSGANDLTFQILDAGRAASNSILDKSLVISEPGDATDYNNKQDLSLPSQFQFYLNPDFTRSHSGNAFLGSDVLDSATGKGINRKLKEEVKAIVSRVIFHKSKNGKPPKVKGVEYFVDGKLKTAYCKHKVVIAAGGLRSSGILERSGIGSKDILTAAGVKDIIFDNPNVGENLNSGIGNGCVIKVDPTLWETMLQVHMELKLVDTPNPYPGWIRRFHVGHYPGTFPPVEPTNALLRSVRASINGINNVLSAGWNNQPTSFGSVHIIDTIPGSEPLIDFPVLSTDEDVRIQREYYLFMKRLERYMQTNYPSSDYTILYPPKKAYAGYPDAPTIVFEGSITDGVLEVNNIISGVIEEGMSVLFPGVVPGTEIAFGISGTGGVGTYLLSINQQASNQKMTGDFLDLYAGSFQILLDHYSSTCRMGDLNTQQGVVDGRLGVYGVRGLMVADNSIYPVQNDGGVLPAQLAGKKAADIILEDLSK